MSSKDGLFGRLLHKIRSLFRLKNQKGPPLVAPGANKKCYMDEMMDSVYGPEGGEGEQWPHKGL